MSIFCGGALRLGYPGVAEQEKGKIAESDKARHEQLRQIISLRGGCYALGVVTVIGVIGWNMATAPMAQEVCRLVTCVCVWRGFSA